MVVGKFLKRAFFLPLFLSRRKIKEFVIVYSKLIYLGQTGLGKSTLVNTLFASHLIDSKGRRNVDEIDNQTTRIEAVSHGKS